MLCTSIQSAALSPYFNSQYFARPILKFRTLLNTANQFCIWGKTRVLSRSANFHIDIRTPLQVSYRRNRHLPAIHVPSCTKPFARNFPNMRVVWWRSYPMALCRAWLVCRNGNTSKSPQWRNKSLPGWSHVATLYLHGQRHWPLRSKRFVDSVGWSVPFPNSRILSRC